ncbi:unnamed protein product, partial [marine sediment metagenome]
MKKRLTLVLAICIILSAVATASDISVSSNTAETTGYIFWEAQDIYLNTQYFSELENPVLFLQFDTPGASAPGLFQIGSGWWLNNLYVAGFYGFSNPYTLGTLEDIEIDTDLILDGSGLIVGKTEVRDVEVDYLKGSTNDIKLF